MEQRISLVTLGVADLARARAFYEALGWSGASPGIELAHNVRSPENVDTLLAEVEHAGGTIVRPAARAEWGGTTGAFADPDGYVWEVAHNPDWTINQDGTVHI